MLAILHDGFQADGFTVTRGTQEDDPALPRDCQVFIYFLRLEEAVDVGLQALLEIGVQNNILPVRLLDIEPQAVVFLPVSMRIDRDLLMELISKVRSLH